MKPFNLLVLVFALADALGSDSQQRRSVLGKDAKASSSEKHDLDELIERGEDKTKSRKAHKEKGLSGADLAKKAHAKSMGEKNIKLDVTTIEEQPQQVLNAKKTGVVDAAVKDAEKQKEDMKKENKVRKKEGKEKKKVDASKSKAMLTIHECEKTAARVAYIVPTKEVPLSILVGYLISFDRMKYNEEGDLKFVFEAQESLDKMLEALPKLLREWKIQDENIHRLTVVLKENAIILTEKEVAVLGRAYGESFNGGVGDSMRFQRSCERLFGLAEIMDSQPCDYKYAVLAPAEGRFLPRPETETPGFIDIVKQAIGLGKEKPAEVVPAQGVVDLGSRRLQMTDESQAEILAQTEEEAAELAQLPTPVRLMEMVSSSKFVWGHDCSNVNDKAAQAAVRRMQKNALIFSGSKTSSPRYMKVARLTKNFTMFTLQSQLPVVDVKNRATKFLLELFRASDAKPDTPITTLRRLVLATLGQIPAESAIDFSDVLLFQYYNMLREGLTVSDATKTFPQLPACTADNVSVLDAANNFDKDLQASFSAKVHPLMVSKRMVDAHMPSQAAIMYDKEPTSTEFQSIF